jgi:hypothetical protein
MTLCLGHRDLRISPAEFDEVAAKKAGVMLLDLVKADTVGSGLFELRDDLRAGPQARCGRAQCAVWSRCAEVWQNIKATDVAAAQRQGKPAPGAAWRVAHTDSITD